MSRKRRDTVVLHDSSQEDPEVIRMSQWAEIRQMHVMDGGPKKQIAERLGVDITTVRRAVAQAGTVWTPRSSPSTASKARAAAASAATSA